MKDETRTGKLLELRTPEEMVLRALTQRPQSVALLARKSKLPRMTAFHALLSLRHRGLAERTLHSKRYMWSVIEINQAAKLLQTAFSILMHSEARGERKIFIETYDHPDEIYRVLMGLFTESAGKRLVAIQSTQSARAGIKLLGVTRIVAMNELIKKERVIIEAVLEGSFADLTTEFGKEWADSYSGRQAAITIVSQDVLNVGVDVYVFTHSLVLINWGEGHMLQIIHPEIVSTFQKLIRALAMLGKKMDIKALVQKAKERNFYQDSE